MDHNKITVGIIGGLSDDKFASKIEPLLDCENVGRIYLFRRQGNVFKNNDRVKTLPFVSNKWSNKGIALRSLHDVYNIFGFFVLCLRGKIDLLVGVYLYYHGFYASILGRICNIPFVLILPGSDLQRYLHTKKFDKYFRKASHIAVRGVNSLHKLKQMGYAEDKLSVLPNVFNCEEYMNLDDNGRQYDIVFTGYLRPQKRLDVLLSVVQMIRDSGYPHVKCLIVGDGPEKEKLKVAAGRLGLDGNVEFKGYVKPIKDVLCKARIFVLTSESEGLPMAVVEAMACGLPVVTSNINDIPDIVEHNVNGFLVDPSDAPAFARYIKTLLEDDVKMKQMGANARGKIKKLCGEEYSYDAVKKKWLNILSNMQVPDTSAK